LNDGPPKLKNVLVLTTGLSGSSVATGLIAQAGFWTGEKTELKANATGSYETYENTQLVELNNQLVKCSGKKFDHHFWYDPSLRTHYSSLFDQIDTSEYETFASDLAKHQPWILKDPKLWVTLGFWLPILKKDNINVVIVKRDSRQLWLSQTLKRIIYDYSFLSRSEAETYCLMKAFLKNQGLSFLEIEYDDLIENTDKNLASINNYLSTNLTVDDWHNVYKPAKVTRNSLLLWIKALLIYLKNYRSRIR